jgi:RNA polymerase sigma-70 factor (ECF subfamily)
VEDQQLLARLRADDAAAFDALFRTGYAPLVRFTDRMVRDAAAAEELVQEVMLELWRRRHALDPAGSAQAYLFQAARNRALNHLRHRRVVARTEPLLADDEAVAPSALATVEETELEDAVRAAVATLPPRCRQVFELSRGRGLRYAEIAGLLGVSVKAVEAQMGRALRHLRARLAPWLPAGEAR